MVKQILYLVIVIVFLTISLSCSPERDNPYDQNSPYKSYSQIIGRVMTKASNPIINAKVSLVFKDVNKTISVDSDSNGNYELEYFYNVEQEDSATLVVTKTNFADDGKIISLGIKKTDTINFMLNALPQFSAESITSKYEQLRPFPGDLFSVIFSVRVTDADGAGDIDSVYVVIPELSDTIMLDYDHNNIYNQTVPAELLPGGTLENLIGVDCFFEVLSKPQLRTNSEAYRLNRIVYDVPEQIYPIEDTVSQYFDCIWNSLSLSFPFTYGVEIYYLSEINPIPVLAYDTSDISSNDTIISIPNTLTAGRYLWQALLKDNFGDISKSNQVLFYIRP